MKFTDTNMANMPMTAIEPVVTSFDFILGIIQLIGNISIVLLIFFLIKLCLNKKKADEGTSKAINKKIIIVILIILVVIILTTLVSVVAHMGTPHCKILY